MHTDTVAEKILPGAVPSKHLQGRNLRSKFLSHNQALLRTEYEAV